MSFVYSLARGLEDFILQGSEYEQYLTNPKDLRLIAHNACPITIIVSLAISIPINTGSYTSYNKSHYCIAAYITVTLATSNTTIIK